MVKVGSSVVVDGVGTPNMTAEMSQALGNITGAVTFSTLIASVITATLTGNITVTISNGEYLGHELTLVLTQDGTGTRTATWPANFKKAGGTLTLTTTAGKTDVVRIKWDGTNWNEVARSLNLG